MFDTSEEALPFSLQRVAAEELGETPPKRKEALEKLTKLVSGTTTGTALRQDSVYREFLPSKVPLEARRLCLVLPQSDVHGRPVVFCHVGRWNPEEITYATLQQAFIVCMEYMISDPVAQTLGIVIMVDYEGLTTEKVLSYESRPNQKTTRVLPGLHASSVESGAYFE
ncbi:hypothetical protein MTO96_036795 [Rhipicephalus appendiculatus]